MALEGNHYANMAFSENEFETAACLTPKVSLRALTCTSKCVQQTCKIRDTFLYSWAGKSQDCEGGKK